MHHCDHFGNDGICRARNSSAETNDGHYAGRISLKMSHVLLWRGQEVVRNNLTLVVLEIPISLDLLDANALVHQLSLYSEALSLRRSQGVHVDEIVLARSKFCEYKHSRPRAVDASSFIQQLARGPRIVDPYRWISADPVCYQGCVVSLREFFKVYPRLVVGELKCVTDDRIR